MRQKTLLENTSRKHSLPVVNLEMYMALVSLLSISFLLPGATRIF